MHRLLIVCAALLYAGESFDHKKHAPLKLDCSYCHTGVKAKERAGFPQAAVCKTCHTDFDASAKFPTRRVYRAADYVIFSHAKHAAAKLDCVSCHGPVYQRDVLTREIDHSMKACVDCHKERKATLVCTACHELGQ